MAEAGALQRGDHASVRLRPAQLAAEPGVVYDVVPVRAAGRRLEIGRRVEMADAECGEIIRDARRLVEPELRVQLQAVRGEPPRGRGGRRGPGGGGEAPGWGPRGRAPRRAPRRDARCTG